MSCAVCSIFYEKEGFYCKPKELPDQEFGGVAVALGQKVSFKTSFVQYNVKGYVCGLWTVKHAGVYKCVENMRMY